MPAQRESHSLQHTPIGGETSVLANTTMPIRTPTSMPIDTTITIERDNPSLQEPTRRDIELPLHSPLSAIINLYSCDPNRSYCCHRCQVDCLRESSENLLKGSTEESTNSLFVI